MPGADDHAAIGEHPVQLAGLPDPAVRRRQAQVPLHSDQPFPTVGRALLAAGPRLLDMFRVHMDIPGRRSGPGMSEQLLDREQVHPRQIELAGAKVPQDMRCQLPRPARQVLRGGDGQSPSEYLCGYSTWTFAVLTSGQAA